MQTLLGQPSAVSQLLGLLAQQPAAGQPGQPPPMPAAPMPNVNMTPAPVGQINAGMSTPEQPQSLLGHVHDFMVNHMGGNVPAEYQQGGLLSDADIQSAKPGLMQILSHSDSYRKNLDRILEMRGLALKVAEQRRVMGVRGRMEKMFEPKANETHAERLDRIEAMGAYAMQHGDMETADRMKGIMAEMAIPAKAPNATAPHTVNTTHGIVQWNPDTKAWDATGMTAPAPQGPQPQIISAAMPNADGTPGTPTFFRVPKEGGDATPIGGIVPHPGSSSQNAQNMASEALLRSSVSEMTNADTFMRKYEGDLASGKKSINGLAQFMGGIGNSFTHDDPASRAIQNTALTALNTVNPDLARYIRRGLSFAEGEAGISKRPSDFRTKMAAFLSTAASGASPDMITDIQGRRASILNPLHEVLTEHGKGTAKSPSGGKPKLSQTGYSNGRLKGLTDAQLETHYDLSGVTRR